MRILILDLTHGGDILAEEYLARGHDVTCVDVYDIGTEERKRALGKLGATVCTEAPAGRYDLLLSPAHCPDVFIKDAECAERMTFSGAVESLISDERFRIEVTGVKGKTSSCYLLAHILGCAGKKVFLHTSRGQGPWLDGEHRIERNMSIAPTSLLRLPEGDYDAIVAEVSLGGSGKADIAVITNLVEDYGIARNTRKASGAKAEILCDGTNIVLESERGIWSPVCPGRLVTYGGRISTVSAPALGRPMRISFDYGGPREVELRGDYLALQYIKAAEAVIAVCSEMGIPADAVTRGLSTFGGVPGRGEISFRDDAWHLNERNPGITHISLRNTLSCLKEMDALGGAFAVVDPVSKKVCDKMDRAEMEKVFEEFGVAHAYTDGCGGEPAVPAGVKMMMRFTKEGFQ
jgi:coenzyme F430 synthetase